MANSVVGIAKVARVENKAEIRVALFDILAKVRQRATIQLPPRAKVMIKVNLCLVKGYETGTTVDPFVAKYLAEWLLQEYNPEIIYIGEADATELDADIAFKVLGWEAKFSDMPKVELINLAKDECINVKLEGGLFFKELAMSRKYMEADFLISLAKLKTNSMTGITCILKNQFGITPVKYKAQYHEHLNEAIYDLNRFKPPDLCLVDGIIAMEGEGPVAGIPKPTGLLIVGNDPVAADHACARIMGMSLRKIRHLKLAIKKGLGSTSYEVIGKQIDEVKEKFTEPSLLRKVVAKVYRSNLLNKVGSLARFSWQRKSAISQEIKVGIAGLGAVSELFHLPVLQSIDGVRIVAACERDPLRRERRRKEWNIPVIYEDYEELYENADLEAVFICLPNFLHYEAVKKALEHGLHVFCEKSMGLSAEQAHELVTIARERNLILTVGYNRMLSDNFLEASRIVSSLKLGNILQIHGILVNAGPYAGWIPRSDWFFDEKSGGAVYDSGSHLFSIMTFILNDKITRVSAFSTGSYRLPGIYDEVVGSLQTERGTLGTFNIGWAAATELNSVEIIGSGGCLLVNSYGIEERHGNFGHLEKLTNYLPSAKRIVAEQLGRLGSRGQIDRTYFKEDEAFIKAIAGRGAPFVTGERAVHILAVLDAVKESIETRQETRVKSY